MKIAHFTVTARRATSLLTLTMLSACHCASADGLAEYRVGYIDDPEVDEASGLACAGNGDTHLWTLNDSGSGAVVYRLDDDGHVYGRYELDGVGNRDWEDLARFPVGDGERLVIADIGDNAGQRDAVALHLVDPAGGANGEPVYVNSIRFRYPDGPRDAEGLAVDLDNRRFLVLSKRTIPAELYAIPMDAAGDEVRVATWLGKVDSLPQPSTLDRRLAPLRLDWFWQPTGFDISADGRTAVVITYAGAYLYEREAGSDWADALRTAPRQFNIAGMGIVEAVCLAGDAIYLTVEADRPPVYRIPLDDPRWRSKTP